MKLNYLSLLAAPLLLSFPAAGEVNIPLPGADAPTHIYDPATLSADDFNDIRRAAEAGDATSQYLLAVFYAKGATVLDIPPEDCEKEAIAWYRKAAVNGNPAALYELALRHMHGAGVTQNPQQARALLLQAAERRHAPAQLLLAEICIDGSEPEFGEAAKWLRQYRSVNPDAKSAYLLALCYLQQYENIGSTEEEGHRLMQEAAEGGSAAAQFQIGLDCFYGYRQDANPAKAAEWISKAAEQGHPEASLYLGRMYMQGNGVKQNSEKGVKLLRKAAEAGNADAQYEIGLCCANGVGTKRDTAAAVRWFGMAVEQEHDEAMSALAFRYSVGSGVKTDKAEALRLYKRAANLGNIEAIYNLGHIYEIGDGVPPNRQEALRWYEKAVEAGIENAIQKVQELRLNSTALDAEKILGKLKANKAMFTESCNCDPDPYYASAELENRLKQCAKGKQNLSTYAACLVDLLEGYPARFSAGPGEVVKANDALREALIELMRSGASVNAFGPRLMNATASCHEVLITALHSAADMGDLELARILLDAGANPRAETRIGGRCCDDECSARDRGKTPMDYAKTLEMKVLIRQYLNR